MSTPLKRPTKSKFMTDELDDFINESKYLKEPVKNKKPQKRLQSELIDEDNMPRPVRKFQNSSKKKKEDFNPDHYKEIRGKLLDTMGDQINARKLSNEHLLRSLSEVLEQSKADCIAFKNNQQKLQNLTSALMKCMEQASNAQEQNMKALSEIHGAFKKKSEEAEVIQKEEANKLADQLEEDIEKLQQKLISETKRQDYDILCKTLCKAMETNY